MNQQNEMKEALLIADQIVRTFFGLMMVLSWL